MKVIIIAFHDEDSGASERIGYTVPHWSMAFTPIDHCDDPSMKNELQNESDFEVTQDRELLVAAVVENLRKILEANDTWNGYTKAQLIEMHTTAPAPGQEGGGNG